MASEFFCKNTKAILDKHNSALKQVGYEVAVNTNHVHDRIRERNLNIIDFLRTLDKFLTEKLCLVLYSTNIERPYYSFEIKTKDIIFMAGVVSGTENSCIIVRTVLDPKLHNKYSDEGSVSANTQSITV